MRLIYLDEAGTSKNEPVRVVTAAIINPDLQWYPMLSVMHAWVEEHVPPVMQEGFIFHATNLMNGCEAFPKLETTFERKIELLASFAALARNTGIPVAVGYNRNTQNQPWAKDVKNLHRMEHMLAFTHAVILADIFIRREYPGEQSILIAEDTHEMRRTLRSVPALLRNPDYIAQLPSEMKTHLPIKTTIGPVHFIQKTEDPMLQISDAVAYAVRRYAAGQHGGRELFEAAIGMNVEAMSHNPQTTGAGWFGNWSGGRLTGG